ncbi:MAG: hypothetical protein DRJ96_00650 [Thermoprotei archaeon]|nr:MAG: hypothetical protein DRJ67_05750 [Thermoprotei archaeon]RLE98617.1 MAG: hypothetical protein DRJ96_00650 [Thermoprotei archaeon]
MKRALVIDPYTRREIGFVCLTREELLKAVSNPIRIKILRLLSARPMYVRELAEELGINEQTAYYHVNELKRAGLISEVGVVKRKGAVARRLSTAIDGIAVIFKEEIRHEYERLPGFLDELLHYDRAIMVLSNPIAHGPYRGRGMDHHLAAQLAFYIGCKYGAGSELVIKLDTEMRPEDLQENLIVVGGPVANIVTAKLNKYLPIWFDEARDHSIVSKFSGKMYPDDEIGVIELIENPFNPGKTILVIAGKRHTGTKAAFLALTRRWRELSQPNRYEGSYIAHVVEGVDADGDGILDDAEVLE